MAIKSLDNESELLAKIAAGDKLAFSILFDHYQKYVFSFSRKLMRSEEVAEEVVQDVFMKIWEGRDNLKKIDNFGGYLTIVVRNHSFNLIRQLAHKQKVREELVVSLSEEDYSTQHAIDYRETARILDEVLYHLPEQQRIVYSLCHLDGLKYEEAAVKMNISISTVHYHMKLALKNIREYVVKNGLHSYILLFFLLD